MIDFYLNNLQNELNVFKLKQKLKNTSWKPREKFSYKTRIDLTKKIISKKLLKNT